MNKLSFKIFKSQPLKKIKLELIKSEKYSKKFIESVISGLAKSSVRRSGNRGDK